MIQILLLASTAFTSLFAILNSVFILLSPDGSQLWNISRLAVAIFIISAGVLTWSFFRGQNSKKQLQRLLSLSSIGLMLLGIAGTFMAIYSGQTTGDFEYYLFPFHALLFGQGTLTFWSLRKKGLAV